MGKVERRDDDTAVVIPTSNGRKGGKDPCPYRKQKLEEQEPIPDGEWIRGVVSQHGFTLKTPDPSPDEETTEWIHTDTAVNARDHQ